MKRFALLIAAVLLVGCSSNSPVAPGDTIYNVTGGEALFKVELKDYPLVVDSVVADASGSQWHNTVVSCHYDIPFTFNRDNFLCAEFSNRSYVFFKDTFGNAPDSSIQTALSQLRGIMFAAVLDNIWRERMVFPPFTNITQFKATLVDNKIKVVLLIDIPTLRDSTTDVDSVSTAQRNNKINTIFSDSWFTFKIYKAINS